MYEQVVAKVDALLDSNTHFAKARSDKDKNYYTTKTASLEKQVDALIYELFALTDADIQII